MNSSGIVSSRLAEPYGSSSSLRHRGSVLLSRSSAISSIDEVMLMPAPCCCYLLLSYHNGSSRWFPFSPMKSGRPCGVLMALNVACD